MAVRCFWPPESVMPRSPTAVEKPREIRGISAAMCAVVAASRISARLRRPAEGDVLGMSRRRGRSPAGRSDVAAQLGERVLADRFAVDQHRAFGCVVRRGISETSVDCRSGGADDGQRGAGGNIEADVVQDFRTARWVSEAEVAELNMTGERGI